MATSAHRTVRKQPEKSGSDSKAESDGAELPPLYQPIIVKFDTDEYTYFEPKVTFDLLLREAQGKFKGIAPDFYYLWSYLLSEARHRREKIRDLAAWLEKHDKKWTFESYFSALLHHLILTKRDPVLVELKSSVRLGSRKVLIEGEKIKITYPCFEFNETEGVITEKDLAGYDLYLLKVPKPQYGLEWVTEEKLASLMHAVAKKAAPLRRTKTRKSVHEVMAKALVCLATTERDFISLNKLKKIPEFETISGVERSKSTMNTARGYITGILREMEFRLKNDPRAPRITD